MCLNETFIKAINGNKWIMFLRQFHTPLFQLNNGVIADKMRLNIFLCVHGFNRAINLTIL